ncbi:biotin/lipoyl-binding protein [Candidatus Bathyarchaeota archaeon]|nr:biotin/lipoyl-binding protein [Candidatus Bathyarchaeota archaeon]
MGFSWAPKPSRIWCIKLPTYKIFIDGKPRKIELTKTGETSFAVKVDNKPVNVRLPEEKLNLEKAFSINVDGKTYKAELPKIDYDKLFPVKVEEVTFKAEIKTPATKSTLTAFEPIALTSTVRKTATTKQAIEGAVTAPMTGRILSVKVEKGNHVETGQILCILEAMKMENEIVAPKAGTVREVYASEGSSVNEGEPLFLID